MVIISGVPIFRIFTVNYASCESQQIQMIQTTFRAFLKKFLKTHSTYNFLIGCVNLITLVVGDLAIFGYLARKCWKVVSLAVLHIS